MELEVGERSILERSVLQGDGASSVDAILEDRLHQGEARELGRAVDSLRRMPQLQGERSVLMRRDRS